jgi:hypothetical protein
VREGDNLTGNKGTKANPTNDKHTNATISVKGEKVLILLLICIIHYQNQTCPKAKCHFQNHVK